MARHRLRTGRLRLHALLVHAHAHRAREGAVAAAVTSVGIGLTSTPLAIIADKPFILAIRENHLGTIMFIGKVLEL